MPHRAAAHTVRPVIVLGSPADHVRDLLTAARRELLLATAGTAAAGLVAAAALFGRLAGGPGLLLTVAIVAALAALLSGSKVGAARASVAKARAGTRAEDLVAAEMRRMRPAAVGFGLLLGAGGDADVVVAGPCLATVEVKSGRGPLRLEGRKLTVGGRLMHGDPPAQARRQAAALHRATGRHTAAVVCVVDATGPSLQVGDVTVCSLAALPGVLAGLPRRLSAEAAVALLHQLAERSAELDATVGAAPVRDNDRRPQRSR